MITVIANQISGSLTSRLRKAIEYMEQFYPTSRAQYAESQEYMELTASLSEVIHARAKSIDDAIKGALDNCNISEMIGLTDDNRFIIVKLDAELEKMIIKAQQLKISKWDCETMS